MSSKNIEYEGYKLTKNSGFPCPLCQKDLTITTTQHTIPHFGDTDFVVYSCSVCNYKATDIEPIDKKKPAKYVLEIENEKDLSIKVVRGKDSTITIKELEVSLEPANSSFGFYSNIQGVLERFKKSLIIMLDSHSKEEDGYNKLINMIAQIDECINGQHKLTFILESPKGYGAVLSPKAKKKEI